MLRILHLEDRSQDAIRIQTSLDENGVKADYTLAANHVEFRQALNSGKFDLVLADNMSPNFSAINALREVRAKSSDLGFICVSGLVQEEHAREALEAGALAYIQKDRTLDLVAALRAEERRQRFEWKQRAMTRLVTAVQELSLARDLDGIMKTVRKAARELTGADGATFVLRDGDLCHYADEDAIEPLWKGQRFPLTACISGWAMLNRESAIIPDIYADARIPADAYRPTFVKSLVMVPIRTKAPIAAIGNYWATQRQPTSDEVELLQALANTTSVAMENVSILADLERRVEDRTVQLKQANLQLESANRELESFSYAVAHDLGAPLRGISHFSQMTMNDGAATLSDKGKRYLGLVQSCAKEMRELIEDLLRLSNISRSEIKLAPVNLSKIAEAICEQLAAREPERKVNIHIAEGLDTEGDAGLLKIVLENLLSNAWKYSGKKEVAQIEFKSETTPEGLTAYVVQDNGVGFDMEFAGKLFRPFQRLHSKDEFPGTGVGLSTVQRIVERHGGKIWLESQPDQGTTARFTL